MFTVELASFLTGASSRRLRYWKRTGLLVPEVKKERPPLWSYRDLVALRTFVRLREDGVSLQKIRRAVAELPEFDYFEHPAAYRFATDGRTVFVEDEDGLALDLVKRKGARTLLTFQEIFAPFDVDGRRVVDFRRPSAHVEVAPSRLAGWPTIENSRIAYDTIALLVEGDVPPERVSHFYPSVSAAQAADARDLHRAVLALAA